mmetsp:Transcript_8128/g.35928  ORF Transcript_8128/g.35928 Transcript_8128/m.35928 type:complete len:221 (-) Transcript_8128:808-1470(-)
MTWNTTGTSTRKSSAVSRVRRDLRARSFSRSSSGDLSLVAHNLLRAACVAAAKSARGAPLGSAGKDRGDEVWGTSTQRCRASRRDTLSPPSSSTTSTETCFPRASAALLLAARSSSRGWSPRASMPSAKVRADPIRSSASSRSARIASGGVRRPSGVRTRRRSEALFRKRIFRVSLLWIIQSAEFSTPLILDVAGLLTQGPGSFTRGARPPPPPGAPAGS